MYAVMMSRAEFDEIVGRAATLTYGLSFPEEAEDQWAPAAIQRRRSWQELIRSWYAMRHTPSADRDRVKLVLRLIGQYPRTRISIPPERVWAVGWQNLPATEQVYVYCVPEINAPGAGEHTIVDLRPATQQTHRSGGIFYGEPNTVTLPLLVRFVPREAVERGGVSQEASDRARQCGLDLGMSHRELAPVIAAALLSMSQADLEHVRGLRRQSGGLRIDVDRELPRNGFEVLFRPERAGSMRFEEVPEYAASVAVPFETIAGRREPPETGERIAVNCNLDMSRFSHEQHIIVTVGLERLNPTYSQQLQTAALEGASVVVDALQRGSGDVHLLTFRALGYRRAIPVSSYVGHPAWANELNDPGARRMAAQMAIAASGAQQAGEALRNFGRVSGRAAGRYEPYEFHEYPDIPTPRAEDPAAVARREALKQVQLQIEKGDTTQRKLSKKHKQRGTSNVAHDKHSVSQNIVNPRFARRARRVEQKGD